MACHSFFLINDFFYQFIVTFNVVKHPQGKLVRVITYAIAATYCEYSFQ